MKAYLRIIKEIIGYEILLSPLAVLLGYIKDTMIRKHHVLVGNMLLTARSYWQNIGRTACFLIQTNTEGKHGRRLK